MYQKLSSVSVLFTLYLASQPVIRPQLNRVLQIDLDPHLEGK